MGGKRRSLVGERFGKQVVTKELGRGYVRIKCDCGRSKKTAKQYLVNGHSRSCGCGRYADRTVPIGLGEYFGELAVIKKLGTNGHKREVLVECSCGRRKVVFEGDLRRGDVKSCGCFRRRRMQNLARTHGESGQHKTVLYNTWSCMWERVRYKPGYRDRTIFPRWRDYVTFRDYVNEHLGPRPEGHSLDRIDNDKGYEPGNIRWATAKTQTRNRSSNRIITVDGTSMCIADWADRIGAKQPQVIYARLRGGWSERDAVTIPAFTRNPVVTANGKTHTINEWASASKVPASTIRLRLRKGWPPELAVTAQRWHRHKQ